VKTEGSKSFVKAGLRIDVDTFRGTRLGVPRLLEILQTEQIKASFFFSVGPDNMGRHLWRLLKPAFLLKMLRSNAASLYGWDILLRGTFWPGVEIGKKLPANIKAAADAGHEIGFHAWDHYAWQTHTNEFTAEQIADSLHKGYDSLRRITGAAPVSSAVAGWRCNDSTLLEKETLGYRYNSDCRGVSIFRPVIDSNVLTPQIPVTLPTYDEIIGQQGVSNENYNQTILSQIKPGQLNVYTIHAEVEGIVCADLFIDMITQARQRNIQFVPLGDLLDELDINHLPQGQIINRSIPGREGWISFQQDN
jgi:undecaprenyl phosphate-alpha-L-ara4FN deformylase